MLNGTSFSFIRLCSCKHSVTVPPPRKPWCASTPLNLNINPHFSFSMVIEINPKICHGKPVVKGTRIMVANVLSLFAGGYNLHQIEEYYPELTPTQIKECVQYAVKAVQEEEILLP